MSKDYAAESVLFVCVFACSIGFSFLGQLRLGQLKMGQLSRKGCEFENDKR